MRIIKSFALSGSALMLMSAFAFGQSNPCNPCNPCGMGIHFKIGNPKNMASFTSEAPLEAFVGTSNKITGYINFDPKNPKKGGHGKLSLDVASFSTGIPLRDEHLRGPDWLDADKYPEITFNITKVKKIKEVKSSKGVKTFEVTLAGDFTLHGKTKNIEVPGTFTYMKESDMTKMQLHGPGNLLVARTKFSVKLSDYGVPSNKFKAIMGSKVGETIEIAVQFFASDASSAGENPCNPCNPCGGKKMKNPCNPCNPCG